MNFGSVCSGIEAASVAWHPLGYRSAWLAEIEAFPAAVLAYHYPEVPNLGDMTKIATEVLSGTVEAPDVLVGGTPCQAFSVAGMRAGLQDARGKLTIEFVRLADAIDHVRIARGQQPAVTVWENVPGVLSDRGNAFGCFLGALAGEDCELQPSGKRWTDAGCVYGPKRAIAWRVLDAQYFGLAQRRRRVFVVASAREGFDPASVLFEREGVRRDTPPRRGQGQDTAGTLASRTGAGGFPGTDEACSGYVQPVSVSLRGREGGATAELGDEVAGCLRASVGGGDKPHVLTVHGTQDPCVSDKAFALGRNHGQENAVFAIQAGALRTNPLSGPDGVGVQADHAYTLEARAEVQAVVACRELAQTITSNYGKQVDNSDTALGPNVVASTSAVRRLTPTECERLQGFPDGYTLVPYRNKEAADGPRYKALGNSMAVPVMRWIGERILQALGAAMQEAA